MAQTLFGARGSTVHRAGRPFGGVRWVSVVVITALFAVVGAVTSAVSIGTAAAQTRPFEGETVTVIGGETSPEIVAAINQSLRAFELTTGMTVVYTPSLDPAAQIALQISSGTPPDVALVDDTLRKSLVAEGQILPVTPVGVQAMIDNTVPALYNLGVTGGLYFGVPVNTSVSSSIWYKPSIFELNSYAAPLTWPAMGTLADRIAADFNSPFCIGANSTTAPGEVLTDWIEDILLRSAGAEVYDGWAANEIAFSDPRVVNAFTEFETFINKSGLTRDGLAGILADDEIVEPAEGLSANECAMVKQGMPLASSLTPSAQAAVEVFNFPTIQGETSVIVDTEWAVAFTARSAVHELLEYLSSVDYTLRRNAAQQSLVGPLSGYVTPNNTLNVVGWHPAEQAMTQSLRAASVVRTDASDMMDSAVTALFRTEMLEMLNGKSVADVVAAIDVALPDIEVPTTCDGLDPTIEGTDGDDVLTGTLGNDVIFGGDGNDVIAGGGGNDIICGGLGDDTIWGNGGNDELFGDDGNDTVRGGPGDDEVHGGNGIDNISGSAGDDVVDAGPGNDFAVRGGTGDDVVRGGLGDDVLVNGNGGEDEVYGDQGADFVVGGPRPDTLRGGDGDDEMKGSGGADQMFGEGGDDVLIGGKAPDTLDGGDGVDECRGGTELDSGFDCEVEVVELACVGIYIAGSLGCLTPTYRCPHPQLELETSAGVAIITVGTGTSCVPTCTAPDVVIVPGRCVRP